MTYETPNTITEWADGAFGQASLFRLINRAMEEMTELNTKVEALGPGDRFDDALVIEAADVAICLARCLYYAKSVPPRPTAAFMPIFEMHADEPRKVVSAITYDITLALCYEAGGKSLLAGGACLRASRRIADLLEGQGRPLVEAVRQKMAMLREREWNTDGSGCGYHVKTIITCPHCGKDISRAAAHDHAATHADD